MCTSRYAYQAPSSMLRARRRDANVRPNRWLDKKSSRGMLFENEELRLRTIEINAEVERGQGDIKKLKRQNEQLRREIWSLRDEYDKLEERMRRMRSSGACSSCEEDEVYRDNEEEDEEDICSDELDEKEQEKLGGAEDDDNRQNAHLASAYTEDKPYEPQTTTIEEKQPMTPDETPEKIDPGEPLDLQRVDRGQPDLLVLPSQNACNTWQASAPCEGRLSEVDGTARGCDDCFERRSTLRCSARRRSVSGIQGSDGVYVDARLSLPVGALESKQQNSEVVGSESSTIPVSDTEPWWLLAPVSAANCDAECGCEMSDSQAWHQQKSAQWIPHAQSPVWAVAPYRGAGDAQLPQSPFATRTRRRAPPPPPPKPTCEQIATVHRASSVLPDGTTRRSVTFHADSVTYIPPPPPPPQLDDVNYIPPVMSAVSPCQDPDNRTCLCSLHSQPLLGCDGEETTLVVRGLERIPNLAARELIDALEQRLGPTLLRQSVRGVCLHQARPSANVVAATVSIVQRDVALRLLLAGLEARGESLQLEEEETLGGAAGTRWRRGSEDQNAGHMLLVSGVTHQVSDSAVRAAVLRASGLRACQVRRHVYKGVDTGERLVRVTSPCLSLLSPKQQSNPSIENGSSEADQVSSSDESKYRSHISVQLRRPEESIEDITPARNLNAANNENSRAVVRPANLQLPGVTHVRTPGSPPGTPRHVTRNISLQLAPLSPDSPGLIVPTSPQVRPQLCNGPLSPPPYTPPPAPPSRGGPTPPIAPAVPARRPSIQAPAKTTALVENTTAAPLECESPTKQRASVNFEERPSGATTGVKKKASGQQNGILRRGDETQGRKAGKSRSVSVESSRVGSGPQRRRHGVFERPSSEELLLEGRGSLSSSREGSGSRQLTVIPPSGGSLPWCACWGNGCI